MEASESRWQSAEREGDRVFTSSSSSGTVMENDGLDRLVARIYLGNEI